MVADKEKAKEEYDGDNNGNSKF